MNERPMSCAIAWQMQLYRHSTSIDPLNGWMPVKPVMQRKLIAFTACKRDIQAC